MNKWIGTGNLGKDPEVRYTQAGKAVASFSVACTERWTTNGEKKESVEWVNVVVWDKLAENCSQYLSKGSKVLVEGKLKTRSYDDKSGVKRYVTEIQAHSVEFLSTKREGAPVEAEQSGGNSQPMDDDQIPF